MADGEYRGLIHRNSADLAAWLAKRPTEAALEPDLPIIDPHHHLWDAPHRDRGRYFLPELLEDTGGGHNIVSTVFLECQAMFRATGPDEMKPVGEVEFVNGVAAMSASGQYGKTRACEAIIGWADLMLGARVREVLEAEIAVAGGRFRGVRYGTSWDEGAAGKHVSRPIPRHRLLDPKFREGFAELGKLGLTFNSWHFFPQLPDLLDLARAFPGQTIIVDHVGGHLGVGQYAGKQAETLPIWKKNMQDLAGCPNVSRQAGRARHDLVRLRLPPARGAALLAGAGRGLEALHRDLHRAVRRRTAACSRATSRPTSSRAATPSCGTPSSSSPRAPRPRRRRRSTAAPRRACTG